VESLPGVLALAIWQRARLEDRALQDALLDPQQWGTQAVTMGCLPWERRLPQEGKAGQSLRERINRKG
jgi:hypothetical protein